MSEPRDWHYWGCPVDECPPGPCDCASKPAPPPPLTVERLAAALEREFGWAWPNGIAKPEWLAIAGRLAALGTSEGEAS